MKSQTAKLYNVYDVPRNFLIGPDGNIIEKNLRGPELQHKIEEILGN